MNDNDNIEELKEQILKLQKKLKSLKKQEELFIEKQKELLINDGWFKKGNHFEKYTSKGYFSKFIKNEKYFYWEVVNQNLKNDVWQSDDFEDFQDCFDNFKLNEDEIVIRHIELNFKTFIPIIFPLRDLQETANEVYNNL